MLRVAGETWTVESDGAEFLAILDENRQVEDSIGAVKLVTMLTCLTSATKDFSRQTELRSPTDRLYKVREWLAVDDGALSQVHIVKATTSDDCDC